jgi:hypothetical protein
MALAMYSMLHSGVTDFMGLAIAGGVLLILAWWFAADLHAALIAKAFAANADPSDAVAAVFKAEAKILIGLKFRNGCPVAAVTLDIGEHG